jgi:hypothetical protein
MSSENEETLSAKINSPAEAIKVAKSEKKPKEEWEVILKEMLAQSHTRSHWTLVLPPKGQRRKMCQAVVVVIKLLPDSEGRQRRRVQRNAPSARAIPDQTSPRCPTPDNHRPTGA